MHSLKSWLDVPLSNRSERAASVSMNFSSLLFLIVMFTHLIKILSMAGGQLDKKWEHLPKSTTDEHLQVKTRITLVPKSYGRITGIKRTVTFGHFELLASKELLLVSRAGYQPWFFFPTLFSYAWSIALLCSRCSASAVTEFSVLIQMQLMAQYVQHKTLLIFYQHTNEKTTCQKQPEVPDFYRMLTVISSILLVFYR